MPVAALARFEVAGIPVQVVKKAIKNLHLSVLPPDGKVRVSAPESLSDASIQMFVCAKLGWIRRQRDKFARQPRQTQRRFVSAVHVGGIEIIDAGFIGGQDLFFCLVDIDPAGRGRKAHAAVAQRRDLVSVSIFSVLHSVILRLMTGARRPAARAGVLQGDFTLLLRQVCRLAAS